MAHAGRNNMRNKKKETGVSEALAQETSIYRRAIAIWRLDGVRVGCCDFPRLGLEDTIFAVPPSDLGEVTGDIELAGDGMLECDMGGVGSWGVSGWRAMERIGDEMGEG